MNSNYPSFNDIQSCPASLIQLQFWVIHEFDPDSPAYNQPSVSVIGGDLDINALNRAVNTLLQRYPVFRTTFTMDDTGAVIQQVAPWKKISIPQANLNPAGGSADESNVRQAVLEEIRKPFDLTNGPPIRFRLFQFDAHSYVLVITAFHIVFDLVTKDLFAGELEKEYRLALSKQTEEEPAPNTDYAVYSAWQKDWMQSDECRKMEDSWRSYLAEAQPALDLPADISSETESPKILPPVDVELSKTFFEKIQAFCRKEKVTPYLVLLTAWALTLARHSGRTNLSIGIPMTNRRQEIFKDTMGCFVNSLPLTLNISDNPTLREALHRLRMGLLQVHRMQEIPYYHLVQLMRREGIIGGDSLYQAGFTFEHPMNLHLAGLEIHPMYIHPGGAQLDLFATFWQQPEKISGVIKYDASRFRTSTVELIRDHLLDAANKICDHPEENTEIVTNVTSGAPKQGPKEDAIKNAVPDEGATVMAIASSFTAEFLQEFLDFWFEKLKWRTETRFAPFNQVFQELLNPSSLLRSNRRGYNVAMVRIEDLINKEEASAWNEEEKGAKISGVLEELKQALTTGAKEMAVPLCFVLCPPSPAGIELEKHASHKIEYFLEELRAVPGISVLTHEEIDRWYPVAEYHEPLGETIGFIPFTRDYLAALATAAVRTLHTASLKPVKALAIDCDGTLWQGVVGEDGPTGVVIGDSQRAFQEFLIRQYHSGVILCLCSKNQEADVWSVFDQHPGMLLKREHISFWKINWEAKSGNLRALARDVNIGLDTFAFLDDNPLERAEVGIHCPSVLCLEFPDAWQERTPWLDHCWLLDHPRATAEDKKRQDHYRSEQIRDSIKHSAGSLAEFLEKLELKIDINPAEEADYDRLAQLSVRTNQFNTTTLRLTIQQVAEYASTKNMSAHIARVRDRFGDYGLVGAMLAHSDGNSYYVDGMFLSCRALGRSVEFRMASYLAKDALNSGCEEIVFPVKTTERNEPARNYLTKLHELCGGTRDSENGLHLNAAVLSEFRYEAVPAPAEGGEAETPKETKEAEESIVTQNQEPFLRLASELNSVSSILSAVEQRTKSLQKKSAAVHAGEVSLPGSDTENLIAEVWKRILGLSRVSTQAKFFEVGGTSLLMVRIAIELRRNHSLNVSIIDMFKYPTVAELAAFLDGKETTRDTSGSQAAESAARQREALSTRHLPDAFKRLKNTRR
ncbi:MAG: Linear gramicidin synthase subunit B [Syntrophus sp. PtaB.Bin138]|nr:MAG: Linear gramicidin synthase subunit B [Syntrophus sp. PtaB.Bin138]